MQPGQFPLSAWQKRIQALMNWTKRQAKRWIAVEHTDPEIVARGESLAALTLVLAVLIVLTLFFALAIHVNGWGPGFLIALLLFVTLPTYTLARRGSIQVAAGYFIVCFSAVNSLLVVANTDPKLGNSILLDSMITLNLTPLLAALLIRPRTALTVALGNNVLQVLMYVVWQSTHTLNDHPYNTITFLIAPMGDQFLLGITCYLLTSRLEAAGHQNKQRLTWLDSMLAALPVAVAVYDSEEHAFAFYNKRFEMLTGVLRAEQRPSATHHSYELQAQESTPSLPDNIWPWESAAHHRSFGQFYAEVSYGDQTSIHIQENTVLIPSMRNSRPTHIVYAAADVSEQRRLQKRIEKLLAELHHFHDQANQQRGRLQELERMKTGLLSSVSHELRTPLNTITSHADLILNGSSGVISETTAQDVRVIVESASYLRTIVNEMLDAAKLDSQTLSPEKQLLDLRSPILGALATIQVLAEQKRLTLLEMLPESPVMVIGDATRLRQIVLNLLSNAVKFTRVGGISLRLDVAGGQARVTVEDTGCGIPDKDQDLIFEQFIQLRSEYGRKPEGTGLGLSIARALAEVHSGALWLERSEVGRGSTFVCALPLAPQDTSTAGEAP